MRYLLLHISCLFLLACGSNDHDTNPEEPAKTTSVSVAFELTEPQLGCYYQLDNKYSDITYTNTISEWWYNKEKAISEQGVGSNLFSEQGGGPNGAEWNSETNLYFAALFPKTEEQMHIKAISVYVNDSVSSIERSMQTTPLGLMITFSIKKEQWIEYLHEIKPKDYEFLFDQEYLQVPEEELAAPLNTGEVFKIEVILETLDNPPAKVSDYFHIAYGE